MSELAFDGNGEPISFPAEAEELRVRRFRNPGMRGACEVVHDRSGAPLYVPIDISYVEFRAIVDGTAGRYRLDPVDSSRRVIAGSPPAYVTLNEGGRNSGGGSFQEERDSVIRELVRANADMAKTMADRFAVVMESVSDLIRSADGAGLTRRQPPPPPPPPPAVEEEDEDDDEDDDEDSSGAAEIAALVAQLIPTIQMWLTTKAAEKSAASPPAAATASAPTSVPAPAPAAAPVPAVGEVGAAAGAVAPAAAAAPTVPDATGDGAPGGIVRNSGTPSASEAAHLLAIYARLKPREQQLVQRVATKMTAEVRAEWLANLSARTPEEAVALVRSLIAESLEPQGGEK